MIKRIYYLKEFYRLYNKSFLRSIKYMILGITFDEFYYNKLNKFINESNKSNKFDDNLLKVHAVNYYILFCNRIYIDKYLNDKLSTDQKRKLNNIIYKLRS